MRTLLTTFTFGGSLDATGQIGLGDFDQDGDLDAFQVQWSTASVHTNQGGAQGGVEGEFVRTQDVTTPLTRQNSTHGGVDIGDLDQDGDLDAITIDENGHGIYLNQGGAQGGLLGEFQFSERLIVTPSGGQGGSIDLADLDADGDLDMVVSSTGSAGPVIVLNQGGLQGGVAGQFSTSQSFSSLPVNGGDVAVADLDGDGDLDAAVSSTSSTSGILINQGGAQGGTIGDFAIGQPLTLSWYVDAGDVDGDGDVDLLMDNINTGSGGILFNQGGAQGGTEGFFDTASPGVLSAAGQASGLLVDLDHDGDPEAITAGYLVHWNQGGLQAGTPDTYSNHAPLPSPANTSAPPAVGDLDGDGDIDLLHTRTGAIFLNEAPQAPTNSAPALTAGATVVAVDEGSTATLNGTFFDAEGNNTVTLTASSGTFTQNNADGTWSWSQDTDDGPHDGTSVTITATDDEGETAEAHFTLAVSNVAPDASISGPASGLLGGSIEFTLGADDVSDADDAAGFTYDIDWDGNGSVDETVSGADGLSVSHTFATGGSATVIVTATDKDGGTSGQVSHTIELIQPVIADIKPGNAQNKVNAKSQGVIAVAIYTTADFDAATVDGSTVQLAGVNADHFALEDVDGDGDLDLVLHFDTQDVKDALGVDLDSGESVTVDAELTGETIDEVMIQGFDTIEFFQPGKGKGKK